MSGVSAKMVCGINGHDWEEVARVFVPPASNLSSLKLDANEGALSRLLCGVTSVEMKCGRCHWVGEQLLLGDHT